MLVFRSRFYSTTVRYYIFGMTMNRTITLNYLLNFSYIILHYQHEQPTELLLLALPKKLLEPLRPVLTAARNCISTFRTTILVCFYFTYLVWTIIYTSIRLHVYSIMRCNVCCYVSSLCFLVKVTGICIFLLNVENLFHRIAKSIICLKSCFRFSRLRHYVKNHVLCSHVSTIIMFLRFEIVWT